MARLSLQQVERLRCRRTIPTLAQSSDEVGPAILGMACLAGLVYMVWSGPGRCEVTRLADAM